jgi:hypothetical protein
VRVLLHSCVKNEANRYWDSWLDWHVPIFGGDNVHIYDDRSDDETTDMAREKKAVVSDGSEEVTFLKHEGQFRQAAWDQFERRMKPEQGDWVFCIDADEFLIGRDDEQSALYRACEWANHQRRGALMVSIPEVFRTDLQEDGKLTNPQVRVDGWWGKIAGTRLFAWQPGGKFSGKAMGCGSEPTYVTTAPRSSLQGLWLLHFGYARPEDVKAKYNRYRSLAVHGHADAHVESIPQPPQLVSWDGPLIDVHLGRRPAPGPGKPIEIPLNPIAQQEN